MSLWRQLSGGVRSLLRRDAADRDVDDEVAHYLEQSAAAWEARGLSPEDARLAARREVGSAAAVREEVRSSGWESSVGSFFADLRYAGRRLRGRPGFALVGILTLALGIGATTAIFSVVDAILFEPIPYSHPERVMTVSQPNGYEGPLGQMGFATIADLGTRVPSFERVAASDSVAVTLTGRGEPEALSAQRVSWTFLRTLGVRPALGRDFEKNDDVPNAAASVILGNGLWRRRFGGDPGIVGRAIPLDGRPATVIGVMPPRFQNVLQPDAQLWMPLRYDASLPEACRYCRHLRALARLRPEATRPQAQRELDRLVTDLRREYPHTYLEPRFPMLPLRDYAVRDARPVLLTVLGAVGFVLLIACVNVTNLLLAQAAQRRGEFAVRTALGAGRGRLVRQVLTESVVLAAAGGTVGVAVAWLGVPALVALAPAGLPLVQTISVNTTVLAFAFALTMAVGVVFGLVPALHAAAGGLHQEMAGSSRRVTSGASRAALVVAEVALALVLLVGSGLLLRSLRRLISVPAGFDPENVLTMQIQTTGPRYETIEATRDYFDRVLAAVRSAPGVESAGLTSQLPLSGDTDQYGVHAEPRPDNSPADREHPGFRYAVSDGYLAAMRIPILRGRGLAATDRGDSPPVAVIDETMAARGWSGRDAVGQRVRIGPSDGGPWYTIVGVAADVKQQSLSAQSDNAIYIPESQWHFADSAMSLVVRTKIAPASMTATLRRAIWSVDKDVPILRIATMRELAERTASQRRFALLLFEAFALVALVLAGAGIYAVLAGAVAERTREIGVRAALGASRAEIVRMVLRQGMAMTAIGVGLGLPAAVGLSRLLASLLFATSRVDPATYASVTGILGGVAVLACWVPAERAARVDPMQTLRAE